MPAEPMTTIKVPKRLRDRLSRQASSRRLTTAGLIAELLDERDRRARFEAVRRAYASTPDQRYSAEVAVWDSLAADGLE